MKKIILKTALITLGVTLILAVAAFGVLSLTAPALMMNFSASVGLTSISGDYAWQEYERSGDYSCLARSFLVAAEHGEDRKAAERFEALYEDGEKFSSFCAEQSVEGRDVPTYSYRNFICGQAAKVAYRIANEGEMERVLSFAQRETDLTFPAGNPLIALSVEAAGRKDGGTCASVLTLLREGEFEHNTEYNAIVKILEGVANA